MKILRIIDANINRVSEGIRVLEDISRFIYNNKSLSNQLRTLRHNVCKTYSHDDLLKVRDVHNDIGKEISNLNTLDHKINQQQVIKSNFKRVQEGLRSIEESLSVLGEHYHSKQYENYRFQAYALEKKMSLNKVDLPSLYGIVTSKVSFYDSPIEIVEQLIESGVKVIQYREKDKSKKEQLKECKVIRKITKQAGVLFIVNDHVDIAMLSKADGVHLGQEDLSIKDVRQLMPYGIIGKSTHNSKQAVQAVRDGADYIGVGPMFPTTTKENVEASEGLTYLKWVSENISCPTVAIGGICAENIPSVLSSGADSIAMISELIGKKDINEQVKAITKLIRGVKNEL